MADQDQDVLYEEENTLRAMLNGTLGEGGARRVKAATLAKLIDLIAANQTPASQFPFEEVLVQCHTLYYCSSQFVELLLAKYAKVKDDQEQARAKLKTLSLLRLLLGELLLSNPESKAVEKIRLFAQEEEAPFARDLAETITRARSKEVPKSKAMWSHMEEGPDPPLLLLPPGVEMTSLDQVHPRELAKQLTLLLAKRFGRLRPREYAYFLRKRTCLFDLIYTHKLRDALMKRKMGNLMNVIARFCGLVHWLRKEVDQSSHRTKTLRFLFDFAQELFRMRNLHALGAVVLVLSPHFDHLEQVLSPTEAGQLKELAQLFHSSESETLDGGGFEFSHSTKRGRELLYHTHSACLPFLGTYLHGMQIINATEAALEDDQQAFLLKTKNMLSLQKMERLSLVMKLLQQFQDRWYGYERVESIRTYLKQSINQGLRSMQLRPLTHLCRETVWLQRVEWRRHKLPRELIDFLAQHRVRLGDVLSVLSSL